MITVNALHKTFRTHQVLKDVTTTIPSSCITAIIGPNGSGKTTLMKCIIGLVRPDTGTIDVDGMTALDNPECRTMIGYMSQVARYPDNLTPQDLVAMIRGIRKGQRDTADELIAEFELEGHMRKPMRVLSGGTRQKVGAVLALMFTPSTVLLDEPTAGLDPLSTERLKERILAMRSQGATIAISSHVLSDIQELADRIVYVQEGIVAYDGTVQELYMQSGETSLGKAVTSIIRRSGALRS
ncbi:MAG: ABC transporter ATP-binding protein [Candidatus Kapabacteria bacterium]|nr:ABC transporter ATP-binding protein [Candidatus Kapabacteria bacterium]